MRLFTMASIILTLLFGTLATSRAQNPQDVLPASAEDGQGQIIVRLLSRLPHKNQFKAMMDAIKHDSSKLTEIILHGDPETYGDILTDKTVDSPKLMQSDYLFVAEIKKQNTKIVTRKIEIIIDDDDKNPITSINDKYCIKDREPYYCLFAIGNHDKVHFAPHKSEIKIAIGDGANQMRYYARRWRMIQSYGWDFLGQGVFGLWVPVGIFATNFQRTVSGLQFSALPVGVALGSKFYFSRSFYMGVSGTAMWAITTGDKIDSGGVKQEAASLSSLGAGFLLDLSSIMYLTVTHQWNFAEGQTNPGWMLGLGFGAELLKRIAAGGS